MDKREREIKHIGHFIKNNQQCSHSSYITNRRTKHLDYHYYRSNEQTNCVTDTYSFTSVYFRIMRKELCRSVRPPDVDLDNVHISRTIMI